MKLKTLKAKRFQIYKYKNQMIPKYKTKIAGYNKSIQVETVKLECN